MDDFKQNIAVGVITELVKDSIKALWNRVREYYSDLDEKDGIDFGNAYESYLHNAANKVRKVKTIIYRREPKDLYSIYECLNVEFSGNIVSTKSVKNLLDYGNKLIISGTAGIGKTTMLRHFFISALEKGDLIPIFVELREVNSKEVKDIDVFNLIYNTLVNYGFNVEKKYFEYSMKGGRYLILYDGFDEVRMENGLNVAKGIRELSTKYPDNYYILSSRPMEEFIGWNDFIEAEAMVLDKKQAFDLIKKLDYDKDTKDKFLNALENGMFERYHSFASNPLLLSIMLMTFDERAEIPDKLNDFYEQAFSALFNVHDGSKDCFKRDIRSGLGADDFKTIFAYFCFKSYFKGDYQFTDSSVRKYLAMAQKKFETIKFNIDDYLTDLNKSVCMLIKDGLNYIFAHRSFQEYFAAYYTTKLVDSDQAKLIHGWLTEKRGFSQDPYFLMLFNMQGDKFNRVILSKPLERLQTYYNGTFNFDFLSKLFDRVSVLPKKLGESNEYSIFIYIKNNYLCASLRMACSFNGYKEESRKNDEEFVLYLSQNRTLTKQKDVSLKEIHNDGMDRACLRQFKWIDGQVKFALYLLTRMEADTSKNKRKVDSIIDSL